MANNENFKRAAAYILGLARDGVVLIRADKERELERVVAGADETDRVYLDFHDAADQWLQSSLTLSVDSSNRRDDAVGNYVADEVVSADVSWPSYGKQGLEKTRRAHALNAHALRAAEHVAAHFSAPTVTVIATAAEREESRARGEANRKRNAVNDLLKFSEIIKGLKLGKANAAKLDSVLSEGIVPGTYAGLDAGRSKERYDAVIEGATLTVTRVA